ncbi:MAG: HDOD domain-containing protein [Desulfobacteraceae bacterium]|nr:HDOD domain-containing protein [Desulfobacteraceae bacterium]
MLLAEDLTPAPPKSDDAATPLARMLMRINRTDEFPSISKYIIEINNKLSTNLEWSNTSELSGIILNDYALTSKLLKLVNSSFYGYAAGKITTVTRAVIILGYEFVRLATISLTLFEHFKSKAHATDMKEEIIRSFWSGILARDIAMNTGLGINPEEAYVSAMLSRFGKLVMVRYLPDEFLKVMNWMKEYGGKESKAVKTVCGITYEELGMAVAQQWNFPPQICNGLKNLSKSDLQNRANPPSGLAALTSFVKELGQQVQSQGLKGYDEAIQNLLDRYQLVLKIEKKQLKELVQGSLDKVVRHAQAMNFSTANSSFINGLQGHVVPVGKTPIGIPDQLSIQPSDSYQLSDANGSKTQSQPISENNPADLIMDGVQEIAQAMMADHNINDIVMMSLEVVFRSLGFHRALMFIRDSFSQMMSVRFGYGQHSQPLIRLVKFKVEAAKDLFNLSVQVGKDLIVADAYDPKISHLIPRWFRSHIDSPAFIFLPIMVQKVTIGAIYADRENSGPPISDTEHRHLSMLRNQLALAIRYREGIK